MGGWLRVGESSFDFVVGAGDKDARPFEPFIRQAASLNVFNNQFSMPHPEIEPDEKKEGDNRLKPIYPSSEKLTKRGLNQKFFQN